jgi:hypothetical protein
LRLSHTYTSCIAHLSLFSSQGGSEKGGDSNTEEEERNDPQNDRFGEDKRADGPFVRSDGERRHDLYAENLRAFEIAKKKKANTHESYKMWDQAGIDAGQDDAESQRGRKRRHVGS